jgi:hypothetical protein
MSSPQPVKMAPGGGWLALKKIWVGPLPGPITTPGGGAGVGLGVGVGMGGCAGEESSQARLRASTTHAASRFVCASAYSAGAA